MLTIRRMGLAAGALTLAALAAGCDSAPAEPTEENVRQRKAAEEAREQTTQKEIRREIDRAYEETRDLH
ncbi:MAG: hypothetical protein ACOCX4_04065 [Planctomycetota bacterium]